MSTENVTNALYPINIGKKRSEFDAFALGEEVYSTRKGGRHVYPDVPWGVHIPGVKNFAISGLKLPVPTGYGYCMIHQLHIWKEGVKLHSENGSAITQIIENPAANLQITCKSKLQLHDSFFVCKTAFIGGFICQFLREVLNSLPVSHGEWGY